MLKIIGLFSVLLSVPALGSNESDGLLDGVSVDQYTQPEALLIAHELYGALLCPSCENSSAEVLSKLLATLPKPVVDSFEESALEIKGAVDPSHTCASHMIDQLSAILSLGALPAVDSAMTSFREISARCKPFLTCTAGHADVIEAFKSKVASLQALAAAAPSE